MKTSFVFILSEYDGFRVDGATTVNINDVSEFQYTFWSPTTCSLGKKQLYITPKRFTDEALDLFYISLMVYCVDKRVSRKEQDDSWTRSLEMYVPVLQLEKWESCKDTLTKALCFLTGDHWSLHFRSRVGLTADEDSYRKGKWRFRRSTRRTDADTFCMLSGGLDSFIGAINLLSDGKKPMFVSHYGGGKGVKSYQDRVVRSISARYGVGLERFFRFYAASSNGLEDSTRSRSLMFFAHAFVLASGMGHHVDLIIPENGVISLNIPLTVMRLGSLSTRTTHPYFMGQLQKLLIDLDLDITLINPFQMLTKGEMIKQCKDQTYLASHYQYTMSCSHPDQGRWTGDDAGHCGECLPCTIRRAAIMAAGLNDVSTYRHNYDTEEGVKALKSYKLGLATPKDSYAAIQMSGPITEHKEEYVKLYEEGIKELKSFIDSL